MLIGTAVGLIGAALGARISIIVGVICALIGVAFLSWPQRKQTGLPQHRPSVKPFAYGEEAGACGLTIANPGYPATDVHIPPVVIAWSGYTLIFTERVPLLTERDHHRFIAAGLVHPPQPSLDGHQLFAVMESANIDTLKFAILFKDDDSRQYKSNCELQRNVSARGGLTVKFLSQELVKDL
jgi:hypothetical protein